MIYEKITSHLHLGSDSHLIPFRTPANGVDLSTKRGASQKVAAWNKQCADKPSYDETCMKKRYALSGELGKFVALVNDELSGSVSPDASDDFLKEYNGRRKIMEHKVRVALYNIKCLGRSASDPHCRAESAAIDAEKTGPSG